ncbi:MAG TPA: HD domain-containing phosphohydrolase [Gemmatimonadaceae bacterium]
MPSPGKLAGAEPLPVPAQRTAAHFLTAAAEHERSMEIPRAMACLESAIEIAEGGTEPAALSEALRRLAVLRHNRDEREPARALAQRSYRVAMSAGQDLLAAEALNTLGVQHLKAGALTEARQAFLEALTLGKDGRVLRGRVEQNLGVVANIRGDVDEALFHYAKSLDAYKEAGNDHGCAIAYHNLGMANSDRALLGDAERDFRASHEIAGRVGDSSLQALCLVSLADVDVARQRFENARQHAEEALALFDRLGERRGKADAYRVLGIVYRELGRTALSESRLLAALELAELSTATLIEAEVSRELALLYQQLGRNQDALGFLNRAHRLFQRLEARSDVINIRSKVAALEGTYFSVVHDWGASIESSDSFTHGHCERVARNTVRVARELGMDDHEETALLVGAYLHDLGMLKVPHELLRKPEALTLAEEYLLQMHPVWGEELLHGVEFPWSVRPIVRWHHERFDGTGFPDRLIGDQIPVAAQVVGILDEYDSLTTPRFGREAMAPDKAAWEMVSRRGRWSPKVFDAFLRVVR